ncbi:MAG: hypothetical protein AB1757_24245 [Acidobacteriota bacterium]
MSKPSRIRVLEKGVVNGFRTGVSLHCHTQHSKEVLDFIPYYAERIPLIASHYRVACARYRQLNGKAMNFADAYWTPPLAARKVYELEKEQIENLLDARALISITDHDTIESATRLHALEEYKTIPVSLEWTVPFGEAYVHLGVHNLPPEFATQIMNALADYTANPLAERLGELLAMLNDLPTVLMVFNHPFWDIECIGQERHNILMKAFLIEHGRQIHALEINGFRPSLENSQTIKLAEQWGYPVISGGDRHGCAANTTLNLTNALNFDEFVDEIRRDKHSEILLTAHHQENVYLRMLEAASDVVRYYADHPLGRRHWTERVFIKGDSGDRPLSYYWKDGEPAWVKLPLWMMRILGSRRLRPAMRLVMNRSEEVAF